MLRMLLLVFVAGTQTKLSLFFPGPLPCTNDHVQPEAASRQRWHRCATLGLVLIPHGWLRAPFERDSMGM